MASAAARVISRCSKAAGLGDGTAAGGKLALTLDPTFISRTTVDSHVILISATNGKSTTSAMIAAALGGKGSVAFNRGGSNMHYGVAMALAYSRRPDFAVLEIDEAVLGDMVRLTRPAAVVLMNLSREHTRGMSLQTTIERWRTMLSGGEVRDTVLVVNADDPLLVGLVTECGVQDSAVWVAGGAAWKADAQVCHCCGSAVVWPSPASPHWHCTGCALVRPTPDWWPDGNQIVTSDGDHTEFATTLPGRWLMSNALFAVATASRFGVAAAESIRAIAAVTDVDGRYQLFDVEGRRLRIILVKNPASWCEAVSLAQLEVPIVFAMESFSFRDMAPIWDVDVEPLRQVQVIASGQRRLDVAVRLEVAGIEAEQVPDPIDAVRRLPPGDVHVVANYTAFKELRSRLREAQCSAS